METQITEVKERRLNIRQKKFCELYARSEEFFGNGTQSYIEAYEPDKSKPNWYKTAMSSASQLLRNIKIIEEINSILEETGFNDAFADKQLSFLMAQHADFMSKLGAIKEYNKLKQRIIERSINFNVNLPKPIYGGKSVQRYNGNKKAVRIIEED